MNDPVNEREVENALLWASMTPGLDLADRRIAVLAAEIHRLRAVVKESLITESLPSVPPTGNPITQSEIDQKT